MSDDYPLVPLSDVLRPISRPEHVEPTSTYHILGAHWYAAGLYTKDVKTGAEIQADKVYRVERDDFVYNRLFAWKGSFALATAENDGCYVSNEFPCFTMNPDRTIGQYLWRYFSQETAWDEALGLSTGGTPTSRNRLKEERLLAMRIPLPPVAEQRRIVARIEALAAKIAEARGLRRQAMEEVNTFSFAAAREAFTEVSSGSPPRPIKGAFRFRTDLIRPTDGITGTLHFVGLQHVESDTGKRLGEDIISAETLDGRKFQFAPGEIVYGYLRPYLNKVWVADREGICSVDQYVLRPIDSEIDTHYLAHFMRSPSFVEQAKILTNNLLLPRLRSGLLESVEMPRPPLSEQQRIVAYLDSVQAKVDAVRRLQTETAAELDALLPAVLHRAFRGEL